MQASTMTLLFVNCFFFAIALTIGFVARGWVAPAKRRKDSRGNNTASPAPLLHPQSLERALEASSRLRDLASTLVSDVDEHHARVDQITATLRSSHPSDAAAAEAEFLRAMAQVTAASEELQQRLEQAEQQIQAQAEEIRAHETEAHTDSLTRLANRRAFDVELDRCCSQWQHTQTRFSLALLDIDHFKKFNDTYGHQAGDEVLKQVAATLQYVARETDLPCRYGGEEFAIVLPGTGAYDAALLAERARSTIQALSVEFEGKAMQVTVSIGLAEISVVSSEIQLLKRADEALYHSKQAGRNCTHIFDGRRCLPVTPGIALPPEPLDVAEFRSPLESLPNRTLFADELRRRVAETHRTGKPLAILAVEVEGYADFKREHGCAVAQLTLESVAKFLSSTLREMDLLGRLEEGRFGIMLPGTTEQGVLLVSARARKALDDCPIPLGDHESTLTIQIGASVVRTGDTAASLIQCAERQLDPTARNAAMEPAALP